MAYDEMQQLVTRYFTFLDNSIDGILVLHSIRDQDDNIIDFEIRHCNKVGCKLARFPEDATGKTLLQVLPHLAGNDQFIMHKRVVETGEPLQFETTFRNELGEEYGWFIVSLQKVDDGVLSRFIDITEKKNYEDRIERQANLLNSVLEASQHSVVALKAVKDNNEQVVDFVFLTVNNRFANMLGLANMEIIGKSYNEFLKDTGQQGMFNIKCEVMRTGMPYEGEVFYRYNGKETWFNVSITRLGVDGVVQTIVDITESKNAKNRLNKIINTSGAGVVTLQPQFNEKGGVEDFEFGIVNDSMRQFFNMGPTCLSGKKVSSYFSFIKHTSLAEALVKAYETNTTQTLDIHLGQDYDLYFSLRADRIDDELLVTFIDQTPFKKLQYSLQKSIEDLKRSNDSLEAFTTAASHDLKEPIRKINMLVSHLKVKYAEVYKDDPFNAFEKLEVATKRMLLLVDDLLEYAHLSHETPERFDVDLNQVVKQITDDLDLLIEEKQAKIEVGKLPVIKGHKRQLHQLLMNLFNNSLKYSKEDVTPEIKISSLRLKGSETGVAMPENWVDKMFYQIEVSDNGIGFEQKYSNRIFDVFERLHGNHQYKGSGVGLAIARKVVENHDGYILASGEPGSGAVFTVYLPAVQ